MIKVKKISRAEFIEKTRQPHRRYFINVKDLFRVDHCIGDKRKYREIYRFYFFGLFCRATYSEIFEDL